ncbi:UNVERIFIED_CONTAM: hypothetical protein Slati_2318800 [Sesamum latifolium]|uniref:Uncharacterized protein n=1 Tax=Sesamum latifolium TaxID=2727402 RepID=A0AAW2W9M2_9LAMI
MAQKYSAPEKSSSGDADVDEMSSCWGRFIVILSRKRGPRERKSEERQQLLLIFEGGEKGSAVRRFQVQSVELRSELR